jgi:hypothetical protein
LVRSENNQPTNLKTKIVNKTLYYGGERWGESVPGESAGKEVFQMFRVLGGYKVISMGRKRWNPENLAGG